MNEQENAALVRKLYDSFSRGEIETILNNVAEDVDWNSPGPESIPYCGRRKGRSQVREFFAQLQNLNRDMNVTVQDVIAQGDKVVTVCQFRGTATATGRTYDSPVMHFFMIRDGKVTQHIGLVDTAAVLAAQTGAAAAGR
jgi:ketosteroid isomerase-like protein